MSRTNMGKFIFSAVYLVKLFQKHIDITVKTLVTPCRKFRIKIMAENWLKLIWFLSFIHQNNMWSVYLLHEHTQSEPDLIEYILKGTSGTSGTWSSEID